MSIDLVRLRELCAKGLNAQQIATRLGVSVNGVHKAVKRLNVGVDAGKKIVLPGCSSAKSA